MYKFAHDRIFFLNIITQTLINKLNIIIFVLKVMPTGLKSSKNLIFNLNYIFFTSLIYDLEHWL